MEAAKSILNELNAKLQSGDVEGGMSTLLKFKIALLEIQPSNSDEISTLAANGLEAGVLFTVARGDLDAFCRNMAQLKPHYARVQHTQRKTHILGLNLMFLLVENRLSEFHAELELLQQSSKEESFENNPFLGFPIQLERQLMVGSYDEVLSAGSRIPDPSYQFFMDNLLQTVRDSIAECVEVAYQTMAIGDAIRMMKFDSQEELMEYVKEIKDDWIIDGDRLCFQPPPTGSKASDIPSMKLIEQSLTYATEMERII